MARSVGNGLDLKNQRIINLGDASSATDAVTLQQMQAAIRGIDWKASVRAATTGAITLSAAQTIDGVSVIAGDRVLVKDQASALTNGIYVVAAGAWSRSDDADTSAEVTPGMAVSVEEGTVNGDKVFMLTTNGPIVLGTTALTFSILGGSASYTAGNGLTLSGSTFSILLDTASGLIVSGTGLKVDTSVVPRKYAANVGNGSLTAIPVVHNLGSRDVTVEVYDATTYAEIETDVVHTDANTVTLTFASAPASNAYRAVVVG